MNKDRLKDRHEKYLEQIKNLEAQELQLKASLRNLRLNKHVLQGAALELQDIINSISDLPVPPVKPLSPAVENI